MTDETQKGDDLFRLAQTVNQAATLANEIISPSAQDQRKQEIREQAAARQARRRERVAAEITRLQSEIDALRSGASAPADEAPAAPALDMAGLEAMLTKVVRAEQNQHVLEKYADEVRRSEAAHELVLATRKEMDNLKADLDRKDAIATEARQRWTVANDRVNELETALVKAKKAEMAHAEMVEKLENAMKLMAKDEDYHRAQRLRLDAAARRWRLVAMAMAVIATAVAVAGF